MNLPGTICLLTYEIAACIEGIYWFCEIALLVMTLRIMWVQFGTNDEWIKWVLWYTIYNCKQQCHTNGLMHNSFSQLAREVSLFTSVCLFCLLQSFIPRRSYTTFYWKPIWRTILYQISLSPYSLAMDHCDVKIDHTIFVWYISILEVAISCVVW